MSRKIRFVTTAIFWGLIWGFVYFVVEFVLIALVIALLGSKENEVLIINIFVYLIPIIILTCSILFRKWYLCLILIIFIVTESIVYKSFELDFCCF